MMGKMRPKQVWENRFHNKWYHYLESNDFSLIYSQVSNEILKSSATSVLDVGCWSGMLCSALYASGYSGSYFGFDISQNVIEQCKKKFADNPLCSFKCHQWQKGYVNGSFDAVYLGGVLYYINDRESFIQGFIERYDPRCIVIQDLVKTPINIDGFRDDFLCSKKLLDIPMEVNNDPSISQRKIFTLIRK